MATKLTASQKRDREFMALLERSLANQAADHKLELDRVWLDRHTEGFEAGWRAGNQHTVTLFGRLSLWQRIVWRSR